MKFEEAIKFLLDGKVMRREGWSNSHHHVGFDCWENVLMMCHAGRFRRANILFLPYEITRKDLEKDDWIEVKI